MMVTARIQAKRFVSFARLARVVSRAYATDKKSESFLVRPKPRIFWCQKMAFPANRSHRLRWSSAESVVFTFRHCFQVARIHAKLVLATVVNNQFSCDRAIGKFIRNSMDCPLWHTLSNPDPAISLSRSGPEPFPAFIFRTLFDFLPEPNRQWA